MSATATGRFGFKLTEKTVAEVLRGEKAVVMGAYIAYSDVFLKNRRTIARMVMEDTTIEHGKSNFKSYRKGNRST